MKTLKQIRENKFITQKELADLTGLSVITISRIENGVSKPTFSSIKKIAQALKIEPGEIDFTK
ncbi:MULTISPECIES: helix-turn-helix domain-containing protein [Dehalococcoides]|uniref:Helix-turn-helix transcriptional regulator n=1 Tax=Dehalococcoides mccartyi TaxID=61435 RepID=A0AB38Z7V0_9CHLR|nr:helix-turn-helix transcriptional regulator [Dehalococcoides mccartyi]WRO06647.1 helix-turn-helix transcriptional regulator [Dehalococcoides mccartyi]